MFACPKTVPLTMGPLKIGPSPPFFLLPHHTACASLLHFHSSINQSINSFNSFNLIHWLRNGSGAEKPCSLKLHISCSAPIPVPFNYTFRTHSTLPSYSHFPHLLTPSDSFHLPFSNPIPFFHSSYSAAWPISYPSYPYTPIPLPFFSSSPTVPRTIKTISPEFYLERFLIPIDLYWSRTFHFRILHLYSNWHSTLIFSSSLFIPCVSVNQIAVWRFDLGCLPNKRTYYY